MNSGLIPPSSGDIGQDADAGADGFCVSADLGSATLGPSIAFDDEMNVPSTDVCAL